MTGYRSGQADEFVQYLASAAVHANEAAAESAQALSELPGAWKHVAKPRANSADEALLARLLEVPILNADMATEITGQPMSARIAHLVD
ncbi:Filamentation induced by cAMP protein Fic [Rhodococcus sp. AW25M09]|nr:Filamentation induced by cAMP protein Fic [Rhodococcus sp. AW25M09]